VDFTVSLFFSIDFTISDLSKEQLIFLLNDSIGSKGKFILEALLPKRVNAAHSSAVA
jgi:hypothetical protein